MIQSSKIKCGGCVENIEKGFAGISSITDINIDVATNIVTVKGNDLNKTDIENKLSELGYPTTG